MDVGFLVWTAHSLDVPSLIQGRISPGCKAWYEWLRIGNRVRKEFSYPVDHPSVAATLFLCTIILTAAPCCTAAG